MITPTALGEAFARNVDIIKLQSNGLTHAESLLQLPFRANCLNWVAGHLLTNRYSILKLLGQDVPERMAQVQRYERESEPIVADGPGVLPLEQLIALLEAAQDEMLRLLAEATPEQLQQPVAFYGRNSRPVAGWLFFFYFHDTYHTGQAELLRQAAGKDDKII
jgi:hypothetical protein